MRVAVSGQDFWRFDLPWASLLEQMLGDDFLRGQPTAAAVEGLAGRRRFPALSLDLFANAADLSGELPTVFGSVSTGPTAVDSGPSAVGAVGSVTVPFVIPHLVQGYRDENDASHRDLLPIRRDLHQAEAVVDNTNR